VTKVLSFSQEVDITQNESGETTATNDLIDVSDEIYNRFQSALMNREGKKTDSNND